MAMQPRTGTSMSSNMRGRTRTSLGRPDQRHVSADGVMDLPFSFILARRGDRNVLVDCRLHAGRARAPASRGNSASRTGSRRCACSPRLASRPATITDIVVTHAHFDHMGSIARVPEGAAPSSRRASCCPGTRRSRCRTHFGYLTAIIDPDNLRTALEASIEHRLTLVDGDKDNVLPGIHVAARRGPHDRPAVHHRRDGAGASRDLRRLRLFAAPVTGHNNDGVYVPLNNAGGSVWEQLKTIDKLNDAIGGDLSKLVILHDLERWKGLPVERRWEGFGSSGWRTRAGIGDAPGASVR